MRYRKPLAGETVDWKGQPVTVVCCWDGRGGPRNVLIEVATLFGAVKRVVHVSSLPSLREPW